MNWKWTIILIILLLLVVFTVQNYEVVQIKFLFWSFKTSRAIIIFLALFIGFIIGGIASFKKRE